VAEFITSLISRNILELSDNQIKFIIIIFVAVISILIFSFAVIRKRSKPKVDHLFNRILHGELHLSELGLLYERQIGYNLIQAGYEVYFPGAVDGFNDMGRDLIAMNSEEILIIQAKNWSKRKFINEKHIFQLYGSMAHYQLENEDERNIRAVFYTTTNYSNVSREVAKKLKVELRNLDFHRNWPMIKCKVISENKKVYYLPYDDDYDKIVMNLNSGDKFLNQPE
jgi:hypothetical protein